MFTVTYKGFPVACETAQDAVEFIDAADQPSPGSRARITAPATTRKPRTKKGRVKVSRAEKDKRNAKARASYLSKHPKEETTTTTSRLQALPSKPTWPRPGERKPSQYFPGCHCHTEAQPITVDAG